jgi:hypothetical protein
MKIAQFRRIQQENSEEYPQYTIWLRLLEDGQELFNGSVGEYGTGGIENHLLCLTLDSMKIVLTAAGYEVRCDAC